MESVRADTVERWGVQQSQITVTYRFAEPSERAAAILPLEHHLTNRTRLPEKLETVGDHIRRRRLTLKLLQRQVAQQLGVNEATITNWETNGAQPSLKYMPAIIRFLGLQPAAATTERHWRATSSLPNLARAVAEGVRGAIGRGPGHAGQVGARGAAASRGVQGTGNGVPE